MRVISLKSPDMEVLFALDAIDRELIIELLRVHLAATKDKGDKRRARAIHILKVLLGRISGEGASR